MIQVWMKILCKHFSLASNVYKLNRSYFTNKHKSFSTTKAHLNHRTSCLKAVLTWQQQRRDDDDDEREHETRSVACNDDIKYKIFLTHKAIERLENLPKLNASRRSEILSFCAVVFNVNIMLNSSTCLFIVL